MADADHIRAEILTPEGKLYEGDLFQLSVRTVIGEIGVRARHAPMLARLIPNEMRLYESREDFNSRGGTRYAAAEGWLEVFANKVVVLVAEAIDPEQLDQSKLEERIAEAEHRMEEAEEGSAGYSVAREDKARAEAFVQIARGETPQRNIPHEPLPLSD
jgi:F-type H+-transporting ATPase subunit epsilon